MPMLTEEQRDEVQAYRQSLREKTLEELQQLVADAGLSVEEELAERKPAHIRQLVQKMRQEMLDN